MISNKDAKKFLSKDNNYKVSKEDVESFKKIFKNAPKTILKKQVVYLNNDTYFKLHNLYADAKSEDFHYFFSNFYDNNDIIIFDDKETPFLNFTSFTLEDAINRSDIIPTIFYFNKKNKIEFLDFMKSFETIEEITNKISRFVTKIRFDINFLTRDERREKLEKEEYDDFINDLYIFISNYKNPMLESRKQKYRKFLKKLLKERSKIGNYTLHRIYITDNDLLKILKRCVEGGNKDKKKITIKNPTRQSDDKKPKSPFFVYLSDRQIRQLKNIYFDGKTYYLDLSYTQFHKTCFATILLNRDIFYYVLNGKLPDTPKIKQNLPLLAIEMRNLIDFDEEPIIPDWDPKSKPVTVPISKSKTKTIDDIMKKNLLDFSKDPYKQFTPSNPNKIKEEVVKALVNEINHPITKDVLGIRLTKDLKGKISKLTTEAVIGLNWIIRALVLSNKEKLNIYYIDNNYYHLSKKEIEKIIKYYFTSLSLLLNPAQKKP